MSSKSNMSSRISSDSYDSIAVAKDGHSSSHSSKSSTSSRLSAAMKKAKSKLGSSSSSSEEKSQKKPHKSATHSQAFKDTLFAYEVLALTK